MSPPVRSGAGQSPPKIRYLSQTDLKEVEALLERINAQLPTFLDPGVVEEDMVCEPTITFRDWKLIKRLLGDPAPVPLP